MGVVLLALLVRIAQALVLSVRAREPPQVMVERAVLHHQNDERVDGDVAGAGEAVLSLDLRRLGDQRLGGKDGREPREPGEPGRASQEPPATHVAAGPLLLGCCLHLVSVALGQFGPLGLRTASQSKTPSSWRSTFAKSLPGPQSIWSGWPSRALIRSLPGSPLMRSKPLPPPM